MLIDVTVAVMPLKGQQAGRADVEAYADAIYWLEAQAADPEIGPQEAEAVINPECVSAQVRRTSRTRPAMPPSGTPGRVRDGWLPGINRTAPCKGPPVPLISVSPDAKPGYTATSFAEILAPAGHTLAVLGRGQMTPQRILSPIPPGQGNCGHRPPSPGPACQHARQVRGRPGCRYSAMRPARNSTACRLRRRGQRSGVVTAMAGRQPGRTPMRAPDTRQRFQNQKFCVQPLCCTAAPPAAPIRRSDFLPER
jgi:hypothetical protein